MNILQAVVRTMRQPDGTYRLPDDTRLVHRTCFASAQDWWTVCCIANGQEYWLSHAGRWAIPLTWASHDWGPDLGFATPEDACLAWLTWLDGVEEG